MSRPAMVASSNRFSEKILEENRALRDRIEELQHVHQEAGIGLCYLDRDLRYVQINNWLARINGLSAKEHLGRNIHDVLLTI